MNDKSLYAGIQRIASEHPDTRKHLVPLLAKYACGCGDEMLAEDDELEAGRAWGKGDSGRGDPKAPPDDAVPYHKHDNSPPAGTDGSPERAKYNDWFRKTVCPGHKTICGDPSLKK